MIGYVVSAAGGGALVGTVVWGVVRWQADVADWKLRTAQAVRLQAEDMLVQAEWDAVTARALTTETSAYQVIGPSVRVRIGAALTDLREWAAGLGPDMTADWAPGEVRALGEKPPLRKRGRVHPSRRSWPLIEVLPAPTPLVVAQRLAYLQDPSRALRIITVRNA